AALEQVRALLGDQPRRRDLLIEHLHRIQDAYRGLSAAHLVALADEMRLSLAEVYEVASFYAHFDLLIDEDVTPPEVTVRVCDSVTCFMMGAEPLLDALGELSGPGVQVVRAPCMGRCDRAPVAVVGQHYVDRATMASVGRTVAEGRTAPVVPNYRDYDAYVQG